MNALELLSAGVEASADVGHMFSFIVTADDQPGVLAAIFTGTDAPADAFIGRECGLMGTRAKWAPDAVQPTKECWVLVSVAKGQPAVAGIGPYDGGWYRMEVKDFSWFMLATAGSIRDSLERDLPLVMKVIEDAALLQRPGDGPLPPTDKNGRI